MVRPREALVDVPDLKIWLAWLVLGFLIGVLTGNKLFGGAHLERSELLKTCELDLPRNQNCGIVAVPEDL